MTREQKLTLLATIIGSGAVILDGTVVSLALPRIAISLHASFADLQWIIDGYLLSLSALMLLGGSLGDIMGRKKIYLIGLIGFGASSLLCGLSPTSSVLILTRVLQGCFGALLVPGALAIINTNFPAAARGKAIGSWAAWLSIAPALGPLLGGYILQISSWRWVFFINVPLVIACYICAVAGFQESRDAKQRHLDIWGTLLGIVALSGITYGLIEGPANHWHSATLLPLLIGGLAAAAFLYAEKHAADPMVELSLFRSRNFSVTNLNTFALYGALGGFLFIFVIYLQTHLHFSSLQAGASSLPIPIIMFFLSSWMGERASRFGPRFFLGTGPLVLAAGLIYLAPLSAGDSYLLHILPGLLLFAFGLSITVAPLTATVMSSVPDSSSGIASGINNAISRVSGLVVIALLGLAGTAHIYNFAIVLCTCLAATAGIVSLLFIQNPKHRLQSPAGPLPK